MALLASSQIESDRKRSVLQSLKSRMSAPEELDAEIKKAAQTLGIEAFELGSLTEPENTSSRRTIEKLATADSGDA